MDHMEVGHDFETLEAAVRRHLMDALTLAHGNQRRAAALLGVTRWKVARMLKRFALRDFATMIRGEGEHVMRTPIGKGAPEASL